VEKIKTETIKEWENEISKLDVKENLKWIKNNFVNEVGMTTAAGYSGIVLLHHLKDIIPEVDIFFIDTGYHFPETLELVNKIKKEWNLNLKILKPYFEKKDLKKIIGEKPYKINPNLCCHYLKVEPLLRVLHTKKIWISAIRHDQTFTRSHKSKVELDGRGVVKIYPLLNWTKDKTWNYIKLNKLPYNSLHHKGYMSIGCKPCTSKTPEGGHERNGRWKSMPKLECGINL
jgi:phosphoadenosine phosphosulfate reductase